MATGIGARISVGSKTESTYQTFVAPASSDYNRVKSFTVKPRGEQTSGAQNLGIAWPVGQRVHRKRVSGTTVWDHFYQGFERWFLHFFGSKATTGPTDTSAYTHVFTPSITRQVGLSMVANVDLYSLQYKGVKPTSLKFNFRRNDPLEIAMDWIGIPPSSESAVVSSVTFLEDVGSPPCVNPVESTNGFTFSVGTEGGTGYATVGIIDGNVDLSIPHQEDRGNIGADVIAEPTPNGKPFLSTNGSIKKEFIDNSFFTPFLSNTRKALKFSYKSATFIGSSVYYELTLEMKYCRFLSSPPEVSGAGPIEDTLDFVAESPDNATPPVTLTVVNKLVSVS